MSLSKVNKRNRIKKRIRQHVLGSINRPRLSVFRSNKEIYAQLVDDVTGTTLASASSRDKDVINDKGDLMPLALIGIRRLEKLTSINKKISN